MNPNPYHLNRRRSAIRSILRDAVSDARVLITITAFTAASWLVGYGITTLVFMFGESY
ncbi:MAG: hypothetical protein ACK5H0_10495 [Bacteroidota bacterium]|jgi:hypothetical protein